LFKNINPKNLLKMNSKINDNITASSNSAKYFPPPTFPSLPIKTLWEEEIFRQTNKAFRVSLNKIDETLHIGLGHWYFNIQNQTWNPNKGQINIPIIAWKELQKMTKRLESEIERAELMHDINKFDHEGRFYFLFCVYIW